VDGLGRDILSRVIYGGRVSLPVAAAVVILAAIFGTLYGGLAGFLGEWPDEVGMRVVDMVLAFPRSSCHGDRGRAGTQHPQLDAGHAARLWPPYARLARARSWP